jgi:hypothetical protein
MGRVVIGDSEIVLAGNDMQEAAIAAGMPRGAGNVRYVGIPGGLIVNWDEPDQTNGLLFESGPPRLRRPEIPERLTPWKLAHRKAMALARRHA